MESWHSYPSIYNLGHKAVSDLLKSPVIVEEKIDGSQFSFGMDTEGIRFRSKGCELIPSAPEKMFSKGVSEIMAISEKLTPGWTYRGEYLAKPKHNTLAYDRVPNKHIIIFDINVGHESYLSPKEKQKEAERLGLECVPELFSGVVKDIEFFRKLLDTKSVLGGQKIEGVVVKPLGYDLFGKNKKCIMGKFVSEEFKEAHQHAWKEANPSSGDVLEILGAAYATQARWMKAIQHLKESGLLEDSPTDIGLLIKEIPLDVAKECEEEIKDALWKWAWPHIARKLTSGFPAWYKEMLLKKQFEDLSR